MGAPDESDDATQTLLDGVAPEIAAPLERAERAERADGAEQAWESPSRRYAVEGELGVVLYEVLTG